MDAVAAGFGAYIYDRVAGAGGFSVKDFIFMDEAEREGVHERVAVVTGVKLCFTAKVGNSKAVAIAGDAADDALNNGVVLVDDFPFLGSRLDWPEAKRVHYG